MELVAIIVVLDMAVKAVITTSYFTRPKDPTRSCLAIDIILAQNSSKLTSVSWPGIPFEEGYQVQRKAKAILGLALFGLHCYDSRCIAEIHLVFDSERLKQYEHVMRVLSMLKATQPVCRH